VVITRRRATPALNTLRSTRDHQRHASQSENRGACGEAEKEKIDGFQILNHHNFHSKPRATEAVDFL